MNYNELRTIVIDTLKVEAKDEHAKAVREIKQGAAWGAAKASKVQTGKLNKDEDVIAAARKAGISVDSHLSRMGDRARLVSALVESLGDEATGDTVKDATTAMNRYNAAQLLDGGAASYSFNSNGKLYKAFVNVTPIKRNPTTTADRVIAGKLDAELDALETAIAERRAIIAANAAAA